MFRCRSRSGTWKRTFALRPEWPLSPEAGREAAALLAWTGPQRQKPLPACPRAIAAPRPLPILFEAKGEGEVGVTLALSFVPAEPLPRPVYRGIEVRKTARRYDSSAGAATGKALAAAQLGQSVE